MLLFADSSSGRKIRQRSETALGGEVNLEPVDAAAKDDGICL